MNVESFLYAGVSIVLVLLFLIVLRIILQGGFKTQELRRTNLYQGGELMDSVDRRYGSNTFLLALFFLILHVLGFFIATMFILSNNILNFTTIAFILIMLYTALIAKKIQGELVK